MRYYRCECGERECWTSMGVPTCEFCPTCGLTLAEAPGEHRVPQPHAFGEPAWNVDPKTGERWQERECSRCMYVERLTGTDPLAA